jgi:hypothetical protein
MEQKRPRWVDRPEFDWTPQPPLQIEPSASPWEAKEPVVIGFAAPEFVPANDTAPLPLPDRMGRAFARAADQLVGHVWQVGKHSAEAFGRLALPAIAPRLAIGLGQGLLLSLLLFARDVGPDNVVLAGLIMAVTFAPLALVQGLGRIPLRPLLLWVGLTATGLAGLGAYHAWRSAGADPGHAGLWPAGMIAAFLFTGQALLLAHARSNPVRYAVLYESSWRLAMEILLCGLMALGAWSLCNTGAHLLAPQASLPRAFAIPLMTFCLAAASELRAGTLLHLMKRSAVIAFAFLLPPLIFFAIITILFGALSRWQPPLTLCGLQGLLLVIGINASYRGGSEWRPLWRRRAEFLAAFLLPPLALLGTLALHARIAQFGFTGPRVIATAGMLLFGAYALAYAGAALISLSGGRWMARIERTNLTMAFVVMSLFATLASPLGDPVRLAVANQNWRMLHGRVAPEAFDYGYLRHSGLRFGRAVLEGPR